ncbi:hypothetical protein [Photobacterium kishitanii]|uniref:Uncharacterized protein n=1 Tax=Photobacterium kishitanii TaxID=318456 RepID=A0A2T3KMY4_9GAMM|nr:hypothetical protein [Photobacterium kishitanii]PSV01134.1 hypothetical protein C9J27_03685 [Photobacterium kishitanii]
MDKNNNLLDMIAKIIGEGIAEKSLKQIYVKKDDFGNVSIGSNNWSYGNITPVEFTNIKTLLSANGVSIAHITNPPTFKIESFSDLQRFYSEPAKMTKILVGQNIPNAKNMIRLALSVGDDLKVSNNPSEQRLKSL